MKNTLLNLLFLICFIHISTIKAQLTPIDKSATSSTKIFYQNLHKLSEKGFMMGHQDDLSYGIGWKNIEGFWWGKKFCTPEEYKKLYQQTVQYLGSEGVHNVIYAYSTDNFPDETDYLERYPGNDFVDLIGFDTYHRNAPQSNDFFVKSLQRMLSTVENYAEKNHKLFAITETGLEKVTEPNWWTNVLLKGIDKHKISYVLLWRNGRPDHYYVPYPNQQSADDFREFVKNPSVFLGDKIKLENLYKK